MVYETGLTRKAIVKILAGIQPHVFNQFKDNPEGFIIEAARIINNEKAASIIEHITYGVLDYIVYDSDSEREFAKELDVSKEVAVYVKLPPRFYIATPAGNYTPGWAIAFKEGTVKHIYFVAETKGFMDTMEFRGIEDAKIHCAREHFKAISGENEVYDVVNSYQALLERVMK